MSEPTTNAGAVVSICSTAKNADIDLTAAAALTYVVIGNVGKLGGYGNKTNMISYAVLDRLLTLKAKGATDGGSFTIECATDSSDAGQTAMNVCGVPTVSDNFVVKLAYADGDTHYVRGPIGGPEFAGGGNESFRTSMYTLGVNQILRS